MKLSKEFAGKVYDVLIKEAGASNEWDKESDKESFIYHHEKDCDEWRFCGKLGFGGKYWSNSNTVDCYLEDLTPERELIIKQTNLELSKIKE